MKTQKPNNTTTTTTTGKLPVAPSLEIVEAAVLMADISGFSSLSEKLRNEFGDTEGNVGLICSSALTQLLLTRTNFSFF